MHSGKHSCALSRRMGSNSAVNECQPCWSRNTARAVRISCRVYKFGSMRRDLSDIYSRRELRIVTDGPGKSIAENCNTSSTPKQLTIIVPSVGSIYIEQGCCRGWYETSTMRAFRFFLLAWPVNSTKAVARMTHLICHGFILEA
jgi:hypothetical protein